MSSDRLTRQELSWLLAQEARSAADLLRKGVADLTKAGPVVIGESPVSKAIEVTTTLDALDDAMRTLSSLHAGTHAHGRRGRIDVAALILELAPGASVSIEPGRGTEVFGDELELRRMLQVLLTLGTMGGAIDASTPATVRRQGDVIRISVTLGPDSSASSRTEYAWLHRMVVRHGGRLELESGNVTLELPADADNDKKEMAELRRELAAAQEQGEAYARELASMFTRTDTSLPPPSAFPEVDDAFVPVARLARALARELTSEGAAPQHAAIIRELSRFGALEAREPGAIVEAQTLLRAIPSDVARAAEHASITLETSANGSATQVPRAATETVLAFLVAHAVASTPQGGKVGVRVLTSEDGVTLTVEDTGSRIPIAARLALLSLAIDPASIGRPPGVLPFLADTLTRRCGGSVRIDDPEVGARFEAFLPRAR